MLGGVRFGPPSNHSSKTVSSVEVLDVKTKSWKPARALSEGSGHHSSVLVPNSWFDRNWGEFQSQCSAGENT